MSGTSDTPATGRRQVEYHCFNCLRKELDQLEAAGEENITTTGDWTPGQIVQHVGEVVTRSIDGFDFKTPLFVRMMRPLLRAKLKGKALPSGVKLKGGSAALVPPASTKLSDAIAHMRKELDRAEQQKMSADSPIFGRMTHADWVDMHCRHAELHFSFMNPTT